MAKILGPVEARFPDRVILRDTGTLKGRGVFATGFYKKGEVVEVAPVFRLESQNNALPEEIRRITFNWDKTGGCGAEVVLAMGWASLYNSANPSNMTFRASHCNTAMIFTACADIEPGDELTINYDAEGGASYSEVRHWFNARKIDPV